MTCDLLPHLARLADDMCFIHSMTAKSNTHGPAREPDEHGLHARWISQHGRMGDLRARHRVRDLPAFVAIPDPRGVPQIGPRQWDSAFLPAVLSRDGIQRGQTDSQSGATRMRSAPTPTCHA